MGYSVEHFVGNFISWTEFYPRIPKIGTKTEREVRERERERRISQVLSISSFPPSPHTSSRWRFSLRLAAMPLSLSLFLYCSWTLVSAERLCAQNASQLKIFVQKRGREVIYSFKIFLSGQYGAINCSRSEHTGPFSQKIPFFPPLFFIILLFRKASAIKSLVVPQNAVGNTVVAG